MKINLRPSSNWMLLRKAAPSQKPLDLVGGSEIPEKGEAEDPAAVNKPTPSSTSPKKEKRIRGLQDPLKYDAEGNLVPPDRKPKKPSNKWARAKIDSSESAVGKIDPERFKEIRYWMIERENIRKRKEAGLPPPWTNNELMANARWCNVSRNDDKVSRWLWDHFYVHDISPVEMAVATTVARQFNKIETLQRLYPDGYKTLDHKRIKKILDEMNRNGEVIHGGAYIVQGGREGVPKYEAVWESLAQAQRMLKPEDIDTSSFQNTWKNLQKIPGCGSFIAGQYTADLVQVVPGTWEDKYSWAALGPGSAKGCNILFGFEPDAPVNQKIFEKRLAIWTERIHADPKLHEIALDRDLDAQSIQSSFCEYQKWNRLLHGYGRAKNRYKAHLSPEVQAKIRKRP